VAGDTRTLSETALSVSVSDIPADYLTASGSIWIHQEVVSPREIISWVLSSCYRKKMVLLETYSIVTLMANRLREFAGCQEEANR